MEEGQTPIAPAKRSRKIPVIKPSQYESNEAVHRNKDYWKTVFEKMDLSTKESSPEQQSANYAEALPPKLYTKVREIFALKAAGQLKFADSVKQDSEPALLVKEPKLSKRKVIRVEREHDSDTDVEPCERDDKEERNIHQEFLKKTDREQITWPSRYLLPEREDEKSLVKKADDLTDKIAEEFCDYMRQLGGDQTSQLFTPKAIKELFEVGFNSHVSRSLQIVPKELPTVQDKVANASGNPEKSVFNALEREIAKDIRAESKHQVTKAFGRSVPSKQQVHPPENNTRELWRSSKHVPKDLVTLKTVWEGITNLRSVKEYCRWMIEHPEHRRPPYLKSLGMFDTAVLQSRLTFESQGGVEQPPLPTSPTRQLPDAIQHRLSILADAP